MRHRTFHEIDGACHSLTAARNSKPLIHGNSTWNVEEPNTNTDILGGLDCSEGDALAVEGGLDEDQVVVEFKLNVFGAENLFRGGRPFRCLSGGAGTGGHLFLNRECPSRVNNGSQPRPRERPLLGAEQTSILGDWTSESSRNRMSHRVLSHKLFQIACMESPLQTSHLESRLPTILHC